MRTPQSSMSPSDRCEFYLAGWAMGEVRVWIAKPGWDVRIVLPPTASNLSLARSILPCGQPPLGLLAMVFMHGLRRARGPSICRRLDRRTRAGGPHFTTHPQMQSQSAFEVYTFIYARSSRVVSARISKQQSHDPARPIALTHPPKNGKRATLPSRARPGSRPLGAWRVLATRRGASAGAGTVPVLACLRECMHACTSNGSRSPASGASSRRVCGRHARRSREPARVMAPAHSASPRRRSCEWL